MYYENHYILNNFRDTEEEERKMERIMQSCASHSGGMGICKMLQVDDFGGDKLKTDGREKAPEFEKRAKSEVIMR